MPVSKRTIALTLGVLVVAAVPTHAQYFGRNKVQYRDFDFRVLETPHFDIYYYPAEHDAVVELGRLAERWHARLSRALDHTFRERQPIVVYASHAHFTQTTVIAGFLDEGVGGITEHQRGRIALPFAAGLGETDHVLGHELVHAFQRDILKRNSRSIATMPLWFVDGMAEYLSVGGIDPHTAMWLRDAAEQDRLPRIDQLGDPQWFPYRYGQALWAYLAGRFGEDVVARCLKSRAPGGAIGRLAAVTGVDVESLSETWLTSIRETASPRTGDGPASSRRSSGEDAGPPPRAIVTSEDGGGRLNVGPAISPDGKQVVFLSERAALVALVLVVPAIAAAQTSQAPTTTNQGTTSIITQDPESHWIASGFVGSNFGRNAEPSSGEFGGSIGYLWQGKFGAEFDTGVTPSFQLQSNFFGLGIEPQINSYMANAIAALPLGADGAWAPYVSGGGGAISLMSGNEGEAANFLNPNGTKFGGNVGGGLMGFAGNWGFKADVRYYRAAGAYQTSVSGVTPAPSPSPSTPSPGPSPAPSPTPSPTPSPGPYSVPGSGTSQVAPPDGVTSKQLVDTALSGLAFWCANVGVAFRW